MYLQGRLPGWLNRLLACAGLPAPFEKLSEGGAPDVRPVESVGEAKHRAAERAVVDNMKEAYVSSEDGVQQGAPLATTPFCVAIHFKVEECGKTLDVTYGAARFNAADVYLVGLPEHVWPAHHAFHTSIKASMGLEVRFDKMHAYNADMEAGRREAPADMEWPKLHGHRGIPVLNVPVGSPGYVHACMGDKAEVLQEEVNANLSKFLSAKPNRRLRNCLPSKVQAFAEAVDPTVLTVLERVLGVSFEHSTNSDTSTPTPDVFDPQPESALGQGSFNATSSACRNDHSLTDARASASYAAAVREAFGHLHAATAGHLSDADALVVERDA
eukprot:jgi/Tetstr1/435127/TSEL_024095.t1